MEQLRLATWELVWVVVGAAVHLLHAQQAAVCSRDPERNFFSDIDGVQCHVP